MIFNLIIINNRTRISCGKTKNTKKKFKIASESCLFIDCSCQNTSTIDTKLTTINCTNTIGVQGGVSLYFPKRIDTESFMDFNKQIESFILVKNNFKTIADDTFKNLRLDCLELRDNRMELLKANTFRGIKQINRLLIVNEKKLKTIEKNTFLPIKYLLLELDMSYNDITDSDMDKFSIEIIKLNSLQQTLCNQIKMVY